MAVTKTQVIILTISLISSMFCAMVYSLQAPFYPAEAEKKGISSTQYGFVFSVYEVSIFLSSLVSAKFLQDFGTKFILVCGLFLEGASCFAFGFLDSIDDGDTFLTLSFILRIMEATGQASAFTAIITVCSIKFPTSVGTVVSLTQTMFGFGMILGPAVGGFLFHAGGFATPFITVGTILMISSLISACVIPTSKDLLLEESIPRSGGSKGLLKLIQIPVIWVAILTVAAGNASVGYIQVTLEPFIREFNIPSKYLGLMFVCNGLAYSCTSPLWGKVCDKGIPPKFCMSIACVMMCVAFAIIGPFPFINIVEHKLWIIIVGLLIVGVSNGGHFTPSLVDMNQVAIEHGYSSGPDTCSLAAGLWQASFAIGGSLGPSVAGILYDHFGFRFGSLYIIGINIIMATVNICTVRWSRKGKEALDLLPEQCSTETTSLLQSSEELNHSTRKMSHIFVGSLRI